MNCDFTVPSEKIIPPGVLRCLFKVDGEVCLTGLAIKDPKHVMGKGAARQREAVSEEYSGTHCAGFGSVQGNATVDGS